MIALLSAGGIAQLVVSTRSRSPSPDVDVVTMLGHESAGEKTKRKRDSERNDPEMMATQGWRLGGSVECVRLAR